MDAAGPTGMGFFVAALSLLSTATVPVDSIEAAGAAAVVEAMVVVVVVVVSSMAVIVQGLRQDRS